MFFVIDVFFVVFLLGGCFFFYFILYLVRKIRTVFK